ncbi:TonB-dependent receptor [Asticcacaulis sp. EMRT-3]|uniref:TonB-dependent receptor n=1 Tax=Asticcacaulis sp. EMRT-3 TaxID=3040349 RepID=UPI0024AFFC8B|nr:TonB-dependent receptor [Asticcacaulis sp. EMRT-3]MDI7776412.1 TonB-dependent receptor [Asticcacaulis sp. EMRT-3]
MKDTLQTYCVRRRLANGTALALVTLFAGGGMAMAQTAPAAKPAAADEPTVIVVTGTRASQESAINRKKHAKTATDSIAAEDIGTFPDKNIDEAISRIPGIQLDRGDFGEGQSVTVRGQSAENNRVELDGVGVSNTSGGLVDGSGNARGADLRELPADLVKSLDVVKGTTAAMTEGSLGGSIHINTRTGLDFKKPYFQFRFDQQQNSLDKKWTPEWSAIMARKFLDGRLGVIANIDYSEISNAADSEQPNTSGQAGYYRNVDLDQSPDKTFSFNPAVTAAIPGSSILLANSTNSPLDVVTKSANANTKADCLAAFPALAGSGTSAAQNERAYELQSCLNQWNDYTPSLIRLLSHSYFERRVAADIRFDYKLDDDTTVYFKAGIANRNENNKDYTLGLGSPTFNTAAMQTQTIPSGQNLTTTPRTVLPGIGNVTTPYASYPNGVGGNVVTDITNATVDASHHVTSMTMNDGNINVDAVQYYQKIKTLSLQTGLNWHHGPWKIENLLSSTSSDFRRAQLRSAVNFTYGDVTASVTPSGLWTYATPAGVDFYDPANYAQALTQKNALKAAKGTATTAPVQAYTAAQQAQWGTNMSLTWRPIMQHDDETMVKSDITYNFEGRVPFFQDIMGGLQFRTHTGSGYAGGGYTAQSGTGVVGDANYVAPVVVPTNNLTSYYRSCLPTATSTQPCGYGYSANSTLVNNIPVSNPTTQAGITTFTPTELAALIGPALSQKSNFFGDYPDKGDILSSFPILDVQKLASGLNTDAYNYDCMKYCTGSDGKVYQQPHSAYREETQAFYLMTEFDQKLPWGMDFNGNIGTRYIHTTTNATGSMTFTHYALSPSYNGTTNLSQGPGTSVTINTTLTGVTNDWTPSYNLNLWVTPSIVLRYYSGHVIARPSIGQMLPSGTCTIDERYTIAENNPTGQAQDPSCGAVGNPNLKPYKAINHNESVEWYVNKDTMFSLGYYYNNVLIGAPILSTASSGDLFNSVPNPPADPLTGQSLAGTNFLYPTYVNGDAGLQRGIEFSTKMAFTYLPWYLKYTGVDFNYSKLGSAHIASATEQISGATLPPKFQASYFQNLSLWYDDGKLNVRLAYQTRDSFFQCIASCGSNAINDVPGAGLEGKQTVRVPYNPGFPNFREASKYLDLRVNYKLNKQWELYVSGRNIGRATTSETNQGSYGTFSDGTPSVEALTYGGSRWEAGFTYRN